MDRKDAPLITQAMTASQFDRQEYVTSWLGVEMLQFPNDLMTYQRLVYETKPDFVVEIGTWNGGLSLYLATVLQAMGGHGRVITVDIDDGPWKATLRRPELPRSLLDRIIFIHGDSASEKVHARIAKLVRSRSVLFILDGLHTTEHVLKELRIYSPLVGVGGYVIVNDTHLDHTKDIGYVPGPMGAVREFLGETADFVVADSKQPFLVSCFYSGILQRVR